MAEARALLALFAVAVCAVPGQARADGVDPAAAIARGVALRREHHDEEALAQFRAAYEAEPSPRALAQIALAEAALERWVTAEGDLLRAIASDDGWIDRQRSALRLALHEIQGHLGSLEIDGPAGAEVWIDGALKGALPMRAVRLSAGAHLVELRAQGLEASRAAVEVGPSGVARTSFDLRAHDPRPSSAPAPSSVSPTAPPPSPPDVPSAGGEAHHTLAWASAGAAVAFLAGGAVFAAYSADRASLYDGSCAAGATSGSCALYESQAHTAQGLEVGGFVLGGVAAGTAALLFATAHEESEDPAAQAHARRTLAWGAAGGALALIAAGTAATLFAADRASTYAGDPACGAPNAPAPCRSYASDVGTGQTLEIAAFGSAAVAGLTSAALFLSGPKSSPGAPAGAGLQCAPGLAGLSCRYVY